MFEPKEFKRTRFGGSLREVDDPIIDPEILGAKIDEIAGASVKEESLYGKEWAKQNSWETLLPKYNEVLNNLCQL